MYKITYTPFIMGNEIPESKATQAIPVTLSYNEDGTVKIPESSVAPEKSEVIIKEPEGERVTEIKSPITWRAKIGSPTKPQIAGTYDDKNKFVSDLMSAYEKELESRGLSKDYAKYIVAQDALESNWGKSSLARYYNFGGIKETRKGEGVDAKTKESYDGETYTDVVQSFRKFNSIADYVKYKIDLLGNSNYDVFSYNPDQLYTRLVTAKNKYATDPKYLEKMNQMYNSLLALS